MLSICSTCSTCLKTRSVLTHGKPRKDGMRGNTKKIYNVGENDKRAGIG